MESITDAAPRQLARTAGGLYLVNIVLGAFAVSILPWRWPLDHTKS